MQNLTTLSDSELLAATQAQVRRSNEVDADLIALLIEVDDRRLFAAQAYSSMWSYCTEELGFSPDVAGNRLAVMALARRFPRVLDFLRGGRIHVTGLRLLSKVLTSENLESVLTEASGMSKRRIEELVARLNPQPPVEPTIRNLPTPAPAPTLAPVGADAPVLTPSLSPSPPPRRDEVAPLSAEAYLVKFTANPALKRKLEKAQELLGHRVRRGDLAAIVDVALDVLIERVERERFGKHRKPRKTVEEAEAAEDPSRHVPDPIKREVYERDGGQCTFVGPDGRRCQERHGLEFDHLDGWARVRVHRADRITLRCRTHNQFAADQMFGREFMDSKRGRTCPGTSALPLFEADAKPGNR